MTGNRVPRARIELAALLVEAAHSVSGILVAEHPATPSRSYLRPVLGALSAGPGVVCALNDRLEGFVVDEPLPSTPAGLFTLASYASALGWHTESLAVLTADIERISAQAGTFGRAEDPDFERELHDTEELEILRTHAAGTGLPLGEFVAAVAESTLALERFAEACTEIADSLTKDAAVVREFTDQVRLGDGPDSLPTLVRTLLAEMEADR